MNRRNAPHRFALLAILLLAAGLRFNAATRDIRFHPDEALYSTFARNAVTYGDWWLPGPLDKPPLSIYASALSMHFFASKITPLNIIDVPLVKGEFAARLPNVFAGILLIAMLYTITATIYNKPVALLAALLVTISPHAVGFSASAFTDMLMITLGMASVLAMLRGYPAVSGLLLVLSIAAKPHGIFFLTWLPFTMIHNRRLEWRHFLAAFTVGIAALVLWDALRPGESFWSVGNRHINPGHPFSTPDEWGDRLRLWLEFSPELFGPAWLTGGLVAVGLWRIITRGRPYERLLGLFIAGYSSAHIISALPIFDRYLVLAVPPMAMLVAVGLITITKRFNMPQSAVMLSVLLFALPVIPYDTGQYGRRGGDILALADAVNTREFGAIVYDHWLGWEMGYYLGAWSDKRRVYYPTPDDLSMDAPRNPDRAPRYLIAPADVDFIAWLQAAHEAGFRADLERSVPGFVMYRLTRSPD